MGPLPAKEPREADGPHKLFRCIVEKLYNFFIAYKLDPAGRHILAVGAPAGRGAELS